MAAFDRILSGIPEMDQALDNIRLGDNVVWRVSHLEEFRYFCEPYVEQAIKDKRNIVYFRFASHELLVKECPEVKRVEIPLSHQFENFTVEIHKVIEREGIDTFYIFDCLSELQTAWATDLMCNLSVPFFPGYGCLFPYHQREAFLSCGKKDIKYNTITSGCIF